MLKRLLFVFRYGLFWLLFFAVMRLLFLFYHFEQARNLGFAEIFRVFANGFPMDVSMLGYLLVIICAVMVIFFWGGRWLQRILKSLTLGFLIVFSLIGFADLELYRHWGFRIDTTALSYLQSPVEAFASVNVLLFFLLIIFAAGFITGFYMLFLKISRPPGFARMHWAGLPVFALLGALMIIPVRGGFGVTPMNPSVAYFSHNVFSNHAALNTFWNLMYHVVRFRQSQRNYPQYADDQESVAFAESLMVTSHDFQNVLNQSRPNIVIIMLESFTGKAVGAVGGREGVTPNLDALAQESLLFTQLYASGGRSDKGLMSILSGFPAEPTRSLMRQTEKAAKLPSISKSLHKEGYQTAFYYGGDVDFTNMRSYLINAKFDQLISEDDFPASYQNAKWGVHDQYLFERLLADLDNASGPFFKFLFTLSSHEPYDFPGEPILVGNSEEDKFLNSMAYTDRCLGNFFAQAKQRDWYENTLFIILADHGHRFPGQHLRHQPENFSIPMLWLGGPLKEHDKSDRLGSQVDLAATLLFQLDIEHDDFLFSRNLLASHPYSFAYYTFTEGFGFIRPEGTFIWDLQGQMSIEQPADTTIVTDGFRYFTNYYNYYKKF